MGHRRLECNKMKEDNSKEGMERAEKNKRAEKPPEAKRPQTEKANDVGSTANGLLWLQRKNNM